MLWKSLVALGLVLAGLWMHGAVAALASDTKLLLARALIWGTLAGGFVLWLARRPLVEMLVRIAERVEARRSSSIERRRLPGAAERVLAALFVAVCVAVTAVAMAAPDTFVRLFDEDGPFEMSTTILYILSAGACIRLAWRTRGHSTLRLALGLLAALFIVVGGEEISWGQRMFGFATPEGLAAVNVQDEFTLHNIYSISLFTYPALATTAMLLFVAPLFYGFSARGRRIFDALELPVAPPLSAALYAVAVAAYVAVGLRLGTPTPLPISYSQYVPHFDDEMLEFLIAALFAVFALTNWRLVVPGGSAAADASRPRRSATGFRPSA